MILSLQKSEDTSDLLGYGNSFIGPYLCKAGEEEHHSPGPRRLHELFTSRIETNG